MKKIINISPNKAFLTSLDSNTSPIQTSDKQNRVLTKSRYNLQRGRSKQFFYAKHLFDKSQILNHEKQRNKSEEQRIKTLATGFQNPLKISQTERAIKEKKTNNPKIRKNNSKPSNSPPRSKTIPEEIE